MPDIFGNILVRPSKILRDNITHRDVSEGDKRFPVAIRNILGQYVTFYNDGYREVNGIELSDQEIHDSQLLRYTHASLLVGTPIGDKAYLWVDASFNIVEVWLYGKHIKTFSDLKELTNVADERLLGK